MSAAAGFRFYYMNDATFKQIAGQLGEKYHADGFSHCFIIRKSRKGSYGQHCSASTNTCMSVIPGEPYENLAELLEGKNYYIATTNQDAQFFRTFLPRRLLAFREISATGSVNILVQTRFIPTKKRYMSCWTR
mgnify:CR=1 FL=1